MSESNILVYLMRRDLRVKDNPIFHSLSTSKDHGFTHLLPLFVFPAQQMEVSGFISEDSGAKSPYPEARSQVGSFWRCGPHRTKFIAESVWDLKNGLKGVGSDLCIRVGMTGDVIQSILRCINERDGAKIGAVWMVGDEGVEEKRDERAVRAACNDADVPFKMWLDEKYLIDDRDVPFDHPKDYPDIFTSYRKTVEPLRDQPRAVLEAPKKDSLPPLLPDDLLPAQHGPFSIPTTLEGIRSALDRPLSSPLITNPPEYPEGTESAHPFLGGETTGHERLDHFLSTGSMTQYKENRNGLLGTDFSSKFSAWLALGCITARQIHAQMLLFEDGSPDHEKWKDIEGYGKGENAGTKAMRFELLWRDYMRLCARKFGPKLFALGGFRDEPVERWNGTPPKQGMNNDVPYTDIIERFLNGTTGMGLIDASQRELFHTGYTSNRARQNVASFLAKKLNIDWRVGAEWYECMLVDYDLASNWGNWQYVAGVGNDPRGEARIFNPVKQAFDYDPHAEYVKAWVPELRVEGLEPSEVFQAWTVTPEKRESLGLSNLVGVEKPIVRIDFTVNRRGKPNNRKKSNRNSFNSTDSHTSGYSHQSNGHHGNGTVSYPRQNGNGNGNGNYYRQNGSGNVNGHINGNGGRGGGGGGYAGRGYGSTNGHLRNQRGGGGYYNGNGHGHGRGRGGGAGAPGGGGRENRSGWMEKDRGIRDENSGLGVVGGEE